MTAFPPKSKLVDRRPSLKGLVMMDVSNGAERTRAWPRKRGKKLHPKTEEQMEWFRQAQWATKYMAPAMLTAFAEATKGTPLLPRDLATMMFAGRLMNFTLEGGPTIVSEQTRAAVSESLDVFTQTYGKTIMRGEQFWEAIDPIIGNVAGCIIKQTTQKNIITALNYENIPFQVEDLDQALFWNVAAPNDFKIPVDGWYNVSFSTRRLANSGTIFGMGIYKNGVQQINVQHQSRNDGEGIRGMITAPIFCAQLDTLNMRVSDTNAAGRYNDSQCRIVGPL